MIILSCLVNQAVMTEFNSVQTVQIMVHCLAISRVANTPRDGRSRQCPFKFFCQLTIYFDMCLTIVRLPITACLDHRQWSDAARLPAVCNSGFTMFQLSFYHPAYYS